MKLELMPVAVLLGLVLADVVHYVVFVRVLPCDDWWASGARGLWLFTGVYQLLGLAFASFSSPGYVDANWMDDADLVGDDVTTKGKRPFCANCNMPRPLRAHHCKECKRCVMMMDHHCCFLENCIGMRNFRPFIIFLVWFPVHGVLTAGISLAVLGMKEAGTLQGIAIGPTVLYLVGVGLFVTVQMVTQVGMLLRNSTVIEDREKNGAKYLYERMNAKVVDEFDTGSVIGNMKEKLGHNMLCWLLPTPNNEVRYRFKRNPEFIPEYLLVRNADPVECRAIP